MPLDSALPPSEFSMLASLVRTTTLFEQSLPPPWLRQPYLPALPWASRHTQTSNAAGSTAADVVKTRSALPRAVARSLALPTWMA